MQASIDPTHQSSVPRRALYEHARLEPDALLMPLTGPSTAYRLCHAGVLDMFSHTTHCEAMAVFDRRCGA